MNIEYDLVVCNEMDILVWNSALDFMCSYRKSTRSCTRIRLHTRKKDPNTHALQEHAFSFYYMHNEEKNLLTFEIKMLIRR